MDASLLTSSGKMCRVPFALLFSACNAVALSGLRHVAITELDGDTSSCLVSSRPMPRFVLQLWTTEGQQPQSEGIVCA